LPERAPFSLSLSLSRSRSLALPLMVGRAPKSKDRKSIAGPKITARYLLVITSGVCSATCLQITYYFVIRTICEFPCARVRMRARLINIREDRGGAFEGVTWTGGRAINLNPLSADFIITTAYCIRHPRQSRVSNVCHRYRDVKVLAGGLEPRERLVGHASPRVIPVTRVRARVCVCVFPHRGSD
jgi:hypothetical protein